MNLSDKHPLVRCSVCVLLLSLVLVCGASAQVAVEYGILGSKSAPASKIGEALQGRSKPLSEQMATPSANQTSKPRTFQQTGEASSAEAPASGKPNTFTIYSSEGVREVTTEPPPQDTEREK